MLKEDIKFLKIELEYWETSDKPDKDSANRILCFVEDVIKNDCITKITNKQWYKYLDLTRRPIFLNSLENKSARYRWAETTFRIIESTGFNLRTLIKQRIELHPERTLFKLIEGNNTVDYSYKWAGKRIKQIAAAMYELGDYKPRVAIYSENNLEGACCDVACLAYDIFDSPLNIHFGIDTLEYIFKKIDINIAVTDSEQRLNTLIKLREKTGFNFKIVYTGNPELKSDNLNKVYLLDKLTTGLNSAEVDEVLKKRDRLNLHDTATIMFTSGSTGLAKGVVFSIYNLISKRFARAAALPDVGNDELLLCYLPLFHTFGRYLELLGMIFWGGTYTFAGNPSIETLVSLMQKVNPTGLISIPLRWMQIRERFMNESSKSFQMEVFRKLVGTRLRWGLSAAGYLDPKVFLFFHKHGVELCSGFGMTEATGGICMTPPGEYIKNSVGIPLPGINILINPSSELEISGHYVARYLEDGTEIQKTSWISTGDLFKIDKNGHFFIVDRIKDIYKNVKGQTIAPQRVEKMFDGVPGFKRTFLVGDGMAYNTLLIVPDPNDAVFSMAKTKDKTTDYFRSVVSSANHDLAPYERVVDFAIIDRDFEESRNEVTAKGTFKRKVIADNFASEIEKMYKYSNIEFTIDNFTLLIPRWFIRDLGITGYDIDYAKGNLINKINNTVLPVKRNTTNNRIRIGNFEYVINSNHVDLGIFVRQPMLWAGNFSLINFAICKDGWDTSYDKISSQVYLLFDDSIDEKVIININEKLPESKLKELNQVILKAFFTRNKSALEAADKLNELLKTGSHRSIYLVKRRLEALALHPDFAVRSKAYRILLNDEPHLDYSKYFPAFINSELPFLDEASIDEISRQGLEKTKLLSFRQRLESYRTTIKWPASEVMISQFKSILDLLFMTAMRNRNYYNSVREELICWILHKEEPVLSIYAADLFNELSKWFVSTINLHPFEKVFENWKERVEFEESITGDEREDIERVLCCSPFLKESLYLVYDEDKFHLVHVPPSGIQITKEHFPYKNGLFRIQVKTVFGKRFDLMLIMEDDINRAAVKETIYWMIKLAGHPSGPVVLPKFGNFRSSMGAMALQYLDYPTLKERIQEYCSSDELLQPKSQHKWKILFVRAISAFLKAWKNSNEAIIPGIVSPSNVIIPEHDFKENARIISLAGRLKYRKTVSIINPVINNFYLQIIEEHPYIKDILKIEWIFDSLVEILEKDEAIKFLLKLKSDYINEGIYFKEYDLVNSIDSYLETINSEPYLSISFIGAIERYNDWINANPGSTSDAKEQFIRKLYWLYHLERYPEILRYIFYQKTYFADAGIVVKEKLDNLVTAMFKRPGEPATRFVELSELQDVLSSPEDRNVFSKIVFPEITKPLQLELMPVGEDWNKDVVVKTIVKDKNNESYVVRKPVSPFEVGSLYRLFIMDDYPVNISADDQFLIITDDESQESVTGGICYKILQNDVAHLEGIIITSPLRGTGLGGKLLEDFSNRLIAQGIKVLTTHFHMKEFFEKHQFKTDNRWGGLVRFLT